LGIFKQERKPRANRKIIPHCRGSQGLIDKSYHIAKDAKVVGGEIKLISYTYCTLNVITLALGLRPKQGLAKVRTKSEPENQVFYSRGARKCERMNPTLSSELPLWELESQWTFESLKGNWRVQNLLD
jgi:hypothetical protein